MGRLFEFIKNKALVEEITNGCGEFSKYVNNINMMKDITKRLVKFEGRENLTDEDIQEMNFLEVELDSIEGKMEFLQDYDNLYYEKGKSIERLLSNPEKVFEYFCEASKTGFDISVNISNYVFVSKFLNSDTSLLSFDNIWNILNKRFNSYDLLGKESVSMLASKVYYNEFMVLVDVVSKNNEMALYDLENMSDLYKRIYPERVNDGCGLLESFCLNTKYDFSDFFVFATKENNPYKSVNEEKLGFALAHPKVFFEYESALNEVKLKHPYLVKEDIDKKYEENVSLFGDDFIENPEYFINCVNFSLDRIEPKKIKQIGNL